MEGRVVQSEAVKPPPLPFPRETPLPRENSR